MSEMIERVARAGYECSEWGHKQPWDQNPWAQAAWRKCAREVIQAMREPTDAMKGAGAHSHLTTSYGGEDSFDYVSEDDAGVIWHKMIDAAIDGAGR